MNPDITYRRTCASDAREMATLHYRAVHAISQEFYSHEILNSWSPYPNQERIDWLAGVISHPDNIGHIALTSQAVIAGFSILFLQEKVLQALYTDPDYGGHGIGTGLVALVESSARQSGIYKLGLKASLNAAGFYEKQGFRIIGSGQHKLRDGSLMPTIDMDKRLTG